MPFSINAALAASVLMLGASAAGQQSTFEAGELVSFQLPAAMTGPFRTSIAGHFTRHHCNDAVVLVDKKALMVRAPGIHRAALPLPMPSTLPPGFDPNDVNDIVTVPHGRATEHDAIALATGGGLWLWTLEVIDDMEWSPQIVKLGGSAWNGARKLRSADVDGNGSYDILGLMENESSIRCYRRGTPLPAGWLLPLGGPVRDFAVLDFVPGGAPEIVALTGEVSRRVGENTVAFPPGLRAYSTDAYALLFELALPNDRGVVAPWLRESGTPPTLEARVVVATTSGTSHAIESFSASGAAFTGHGSLALTDEAPALAIGRFQNSPTDCVVATLRHEAWPLRIPTNASGAFTAANAIAIGASSLPAGVENLAQPLLADFHGAPYAAATEKHLTKLLYPRASDQTIAYQQEILLGAPFVKPIQDEQPLFRFKVDLANAPAGATHVEIIAWAYSIPDQRVELGEGSEQEDLPATRNVIPFDGQGEATVDVDVPSFGANTWYFTIRFLELDDDETLLRRWPISSMLYGSVDSGIIALIQMLEQLYTPYSPAFVFDANDPEGITGAGTTGPPPPTGGGTSGTNPPPPSGGP